MSPPVYTVKPKNIFKHPFNKFDLDKLINRESQNDDITDYFNYGFNEDTMNIYGKLVKRNIEVLNQNINPSYFDAPSQLMRLNDQIPMDFGGFCKFFDPSIFMDQQTNQEQLQLNCDFHNGQRLFKNLIAVTFLNKPEYPLIDFVKGMYRNDPTQQNWLCDIMDQLQQNLQKRYEQTLKRLIQKKNNINNISTNTQNIDNNNNNGHNQNVKSKKQNHHIPWQYKDNKKQQQNYGNKRQQSSQSSSSNNNDSNDSSSDSSQSSQQKKQKVRERQKSRQRGKKSRHKKAKKSVRNKKEDRKHRDDKKYKSSKKKISKERSREKKKYKSRRK